MNEFVNREGPNLNKKIFCVESVQRDATGEIISINGTLLRNDKDGITQEGTPLNAEKLNEIVKNIANKSIDENLENGTGSISVKINEMIDGNLENETSSIPVKINKIINENLENGTGSIPVKINEMIDGNLENETGSIPVKINEMIDGNLENETGSIPVKINELINKNVSNPSDTIQNKIRSMANGIAKSYTDQQLEEFREEILLTIEQISKNIVEKYVEFTVENLLLEIISDGTTVVPYGELVIPVDEEVTIEIAKSYDELFMYEYGMENNQNFVISIQAKTEPEDTGTCEYKHKFVLKSIESGEIVKKIFLTVRYYTPSVSPED